MTDINIIKEVFKRYNLLETLPEKNVPLIVMKEIKEKIKQQKIDDFAEGIKSFFEVVFPY